MPKDDGSSMLKHMTNIDSTRLQLNRIRNDGQDIVPRFAVHDDEFRPLDLKY